MAVPTWKTQFEKLAVFSGDMDADLEARSQGIEKLLSDLQVEFTNFQKQLEQLQSVDKLPERARNSISISNMNRIVSSVQHAIEQMTVSAREVEFYVRKNQHSAPMRQ